MTREKFIETIKTPVLSGTVKKACLEVTSCVDVMYLHRVVLPEKDLLLIGRHKDGAYSMKLVINDKLIGSFEHFSPEPLYDEGDLYIEPLGCGTTYFEISENILKDICEAEMAEIRYYSNYTKSLEGVDDLSEPSFQAFFQAFYDCVYSSGTYPNALELLKKGTIYAKYRRKFLGIF